MSRRSADYELAKKRLGGVVSVTEGEKADTDAVVIERALIDPDPEQPRQYFDQLELRALGEEMLREQLPGIIVRRHPTTPGRFMLVAGERRWRAAGPEHADIKFLKVTILDLDEDEAVLAQWSENRNRVDLAPIARARGMRRLKKLSPSKVFADYEGEANRELTWDEVAQKERLGGKRSALRYVALLRLPQVVQYTMERLNLSEKHGRALLSLQDVDEDRSERDQEATPNQKRLLSEIERGFDELGKTMTGDDAIVRANQLMGKLPDQHDLELQGVAAKTEGEMREDQRQKAAEEAQARGDAPLRVITLGAPASGTPTAPAQSGGVGYVQTEDAPAGTRIVGEAPREGVSVPRTPITPEGAALALARERATLPNHRHPQGSEPVDERRWPKDIGYPATHSDLPERPQHESTGSAATGESVIPVHDVALLTSSIKKGITQLHQLREQSGLIGPFKVHVSGASALAVTSLRSEAMAFLEAVESLSQSIQAQWAMEDKPHDQE